MPAKSDAANAAAVAACDSQDGVTDGVIAEPRRCHFDAGKVSGLTPQEAKAVNLIWDGPVTHAATVRGAASRAAPPSPPCCPAATP
ncbi:hypothetical protein [Streptomyces canus]|uniref:hypothetical protein n=1 Tax=Streptomyces canus TaxID=58343 RepID=UPI00381FD73E